MECEVGKTYEIEITDEMSNEWTGPLGISHMGDIAINIPKAKKGEKFTVKVLSIGTNQWTGQKEAQIEQV